MQADDRDQPLALEYLSPHVSKTAGDPLLHAMRAWRRRAAWGLLVLLAGAFVWTPSHLVAPEVTLVAAVCTLAAFGWVAVAAVLCLTWMTRYAAANFGRAYAARHLLLAILLAPALLLGVFAVTRLVEADIERWHLDREHRDPPPG